MYNYHSTLSFAGAELSKCWSDQRVTASVVLYLDLNGNEVHGPCSYGSVNPSVATVSRKG